MVWGKLSTQMHSIVREKRTLSLWHVPACDVNAPAGDVHPPACDVHTYTSPATCHSERVHFSRTVACLFPALHTPVIYQWRLFWIRTTTRNACTAGGLPSTPRTTFLCHGRGSRRISSTTSSSRRWKKRGRWVELTSLPTLTRRKTSSVSPLGKEGKIQFKSLPRGDTYDRSHSDFVKDAAELFQRKGNVHTPVARNLFNQRNQHSGESITEWLTELRLI